MSALSRCWFPLVTSVESTTGGDDPDAAARVKQAAILYDELLFERGALHVNISEHGSLLMHRALNEEEVPQQLLRNPPGVDKHRLDVTLDDPRTGERIVVYDGVVTDPYAAELEYCVFSALAELNTGWARAVDPRLPEQPEFSVLLPRRDRDPALTIEQRAAQAWHDYVHHHLAQVAPHAREMQAALSVSAPIARAFGPQPQQIAASRAVRLAVPDVSGLSWEQVLRFREHPAAGEARQRLRELADALPGGQELAVLRFERDLLAAEKDVMKKARSRARLGRLALTVTGVPFASAANELIEPLTERLGERGSWAAAVGLLRDAP